jgi:hypothetical protein
MQIVEKKKTADVSRTNCAGIFQPKKGLFDKLLELPDFYMLMNNGKVVFLL